MALDGVVPVILPLDEDDDLLLPDDLLNLVDLLDFDEDDLDDFGLDLDFFES